MRRTEGFTIIELIAVIVVLGILAAVALPKYLDMSTSALTAACNGFRGAIEGGSAVNFAARTASSTAGVALTTCGTGTVLATSLGALIQGGLPNTISIVSAGSSITNTTGLSGACVIQYSVSAGTCTATANVLAIQ